MALIEKANTIQEINIEVVVTHTSPIFLGVKSPYPTETIVVTAQ